MIKKERELFEQFKKLVAEKLEVEEEKVTLDARFREDLGMESLDMYELLYDIDSELGVSVPDEKAAEFEKVSDAFEFICNEREIIRKEREAIKNRILGLEKIQKKSMALVKSIRDYASEQREQWQKIPWLALQAEGKEGYDGDYRFCWEYGILKLKDHLYVNLAGGEILFVDKGRIDFPSDSCILSLFPFSNILNADSHIEYLESIMNKEDMPFDGDSGVGALFESHEQWRRFTAERYGVDKIYNLGKSILAMGIFRHR